MITESKKKVDFCIYCNEREGTTRDHVPPKGFFLRPYPTDLITVPACIECNEKYKLDEEYVRNLLTCIGPDKQELSMQDFVRRKNTIGRSFERSNKLYRHFISNIKDVDIRTPAGIIVDRKPVLTADNIRLLKVLNKITKGIYFTETGYPLIGEYKTYCLEICTLKDLPDEFKNIFNIFRDKKIIGSHPKVFRYIFADYSEKDYGCRIFMEFYRSKSFLLELLNKNIPEANEPTIYTG